MTGQTKLLEKLETRSPIFKETEPIFRRRLDLLIGAKVQQGNLLTRVLG